jgi:CDP-diacylglycerol--glycerol-3-phosphate 3-phosphatidyltransferase
MRPPEQLATFANRLGCPKPMPKNQQQPNETSSKFNKHAGQKSHLPGDNATHNQALNVPNFLSSVRIIGAFLLVAIALTGRPYWFVGVYLVFALTDLIDGPLARWLGQSSEIGAKLDSVADVSLSTSLLVGATILSWQLLKNELTLIGMAIGSYFICVVVALWKFQRMPSFHTYAAKANHFLVAIGFISLILQWSVWPLRVAAVSTILTNIESTAICWLLDQWETDVPSVFGIKRNRS